MGKKVTCYLCSLESNFFPSKGDLHGIICKRCGSYYIDGFLIACGEPTKAEDKSILSGYTRWEKELKRPIPEIKNENYLKIIKDNKSYSDREKVDKLLLYYSRKQPKRGSFVPYDRNMDYPITFSNDWKEYFYLLNDLADKNLGLVRVETRNSIRIMPEGWKRIEGREVKILELPEIDIDTLIKMDESSQLEFKSTFQWDIENNCKNKNLRNEVIKTFAAFNNTEGGYLLIGINDEKEIVGLEKDYFSFRGKQNKDVFLQTLTHEIENKISKDFATKVDVKFYNLESKDVCRIKVNSGIEPVWVKEDKDTEVFYIRLQNLTKAFSPSESAKYIKKRWR